jgi:hypothetical protein
VRVLVAFENARRLYGDTIARAVGDLRPALGELERELVRFKPHVVVLN